jgi:hypothetical protein
MKTFWSVFFAVLAAAAVIGIVIGISNSFDESHRMKSENKWAEKETARLKHEADFYNEMRERDWQNTVRRINAMPDDPSPTP